MKKFKSVIALALALVLSLGVMSTAFAAQTEEDLTLELEVPEKIVVNYGEEVELKAITGNLGYKKIKWTFSEEEMFEDKSSYIRDLANTLQLSDEGRSFIMMPVKSGTLTVTASIVHYFPEDPYTVNGNPVTVTKDIDIVVYPGVDVYDGGENVTIGYKETHTVEAEGFNLPEGAYLKWIANDDRIELNQSQDGTTCEITKTKCETASLRVVVVDSQGNPIEDKNGNVIEDELEVWTVFSSYGEYISCKFDELFSSFLKFFEILF